MWVAMCASSRSINSMSVQMCTDDKLFVDRGVRVFCHLPWLLGQVLRRQIYWERWSTYIVKYWRDTHV
jgi:hypothetical protein